MSPLPGGCWNKSRLRYIRSYIIHKGGLNLAQTETSTNCTGPHWSCRWVSCSIYLHQDQIDMFQVRVRELVCNRRYPVAPFYSGSWFLYVVVNWLLFGQMAPAVSHFHALNSFFPVFPHWYDVFPNSGHTDPVIIALLSTFFLYCVPRRLMKILPPLYLYPAH